MLASVLSRHVPHRAVVAGALLLVVHAAIARTAPADDSVGEIGADDRLVVRGLTGIDPERLRRALLDDPDLVWLSRPTDSRDEFVASLVGKATLALERAGFAAARVGGRVESSDGVERLVLDVVEGERFMAGRIEVSGLPDDVSARLVRFLSTPQPPLDAVPRSVERPDGTTATTWVDAAGRPATLLDPEWVPGEPAACDAIAAASVRAAVARFLRDEGHLALAPIVERKQSGMLRRGTTFTVHTKWTDAAGTHEAFDVSSRRADGVADLVVAIKELPPRATLRDVDVPSTCSTGKEDLEAFLGITPGMPVNQRHCVEWRDRLRRSGRFVRHDVTLHADPRDPAAAVVRFDLEEYPRATPLGRQLTRAETVMLRFHDWLSAAVGGRDLIIDVRRRTSGAAAAVAARLILPPDGGFVVAALPGAAPACGLLVRNAQASLVPPGGAGRLDVPLPPRMRLAATISLSLDRDGTAKDRQKYTRTLSIGCGISETAASDAAGGVAVELRIEPVACVALLHEGDPKVSFDGDTLVIESGGATSRIDAATGRPLVVVVDGCEVSIETAAGAAEAAAAAVGGAAGPNRLRDEAPVTSAVEFLGSDGVAEACGRLAAAAGFSGEEPWAVGLLRTVAVVRGCLDRCLADGGIARCDAAVLAAVRGGTAPAVEPLEIPREGTPAAPVLAGKALTRQVATFAWQCTEDHCGRDSWPASLVRAAACGLVGDPAIFREMTDFMSQEDYGPLAYACAATLAPVPAIAKSLALRGQERLSTVAFHTDCRPLLKAIERYGLDECCVSVLRSIDDDATRELGRAVAGDRDLLLPLVRSLRSHASHEEAVDSLQASLDAWWEATLRPIVAARLDAVATPRTAAAPAAADEKPLKK